MKVFQLLEAEDWENASVKDDKYLLYITNKLINLDHEQSMWQRRLEDWLKGKVKFTDTNRDSVYFNKIHTKLDQIRKEKDRLYKLRLKSSTHMKHFKHDPRMAYQYAIHVRKGPFPEGEDAIAKDGQYALRYAVECLNKRFLKGEEAMKEYLIRNKGDGGAFDLKSKYYKQFGVKLLP